MLVIKRDASFIKQFSEGILWGIESSSTGVVGTNTWGTFPIMSAPKIKPNEKTASLPDASGANVYNSAILDSYEFSFDILQSDKDSLDLAEYARDKYFMFAYLVGTVGTKQQVQVFPPSQIQTTSETDYSDFVKTGFVFKTIKNDAVVTVTLPTYGSVINVTNSVGIVPIAKQRVILEN